MPVAEAEETEILDLGAPEETAGVSAARAPVEPARVEPAAERPRPRQEEPVSLPPTMRSILELGEWWRKRLDEVDYYIEPADALALAINIKQRIVPLLLEGPPGVGKTSLIYAVARVLRQTRVERLNCHRKVGVEKLLYDWDEGLQNLEIAKAERQADGATIDDYTHIRYNSKCLKPGVYVRAFRSTHQHPIVLINEIDKVPEQEAFEATTLEVIEENTITVEENGESLRPVTGLAPHTFITSNAGVRGSSERESLSHPLLRRCDYICLPEPDKEREYEVLRACAPELPTAVLRECALFMEAMRRFVRLQKPISLSEGITWVRAVREFLPLPHLTPEIAQATIFRLAKSQEDRTRVISNFKDIFTHIGDTKKVWHPRADK